MERQPQSPDNHCSVPIIRVEDYQQPSSEAGPHGAAKQISDTWTYDLNLRLDPTLAILTAVSDALSHYANVYIR